MTRPFLLRSRGERGASMVEAAVVTPVVVAMLFGIIEFGMLFKDYLGANAMVRAGVRTASANPRSATFAQVTADQMRNTGLAVAPGNVEQLWIYKANTTNDFPVGFSDFSGCTTCVTFRWDAGTSRFVVDRNGWLSTNQNACPSGQGGPPDRVGVYIRVRHEPMTGIIRTLTLTESSVSYLEPFPALQGCKP